MSLWKYSFDLVTKELELAKKKKQALDELFDSKKISQSTHEYLNKELIEAITDLQTHLNMLADKMTARTKELEKQVSTLELFLASSEIHHAAGDIDKESYEAQSKAILLGLETTKQELYEIKEALSLIGFDQAESQISSAITKKAEIESTTNEIELTANETTLMTTQEET